MLEIIDEPLEPGRVVLGRFRLERPVGEGGMGVVWAARTIADDRSIALKFLRKERDPDPKSRARFMREARAAIAVSHPNVAKVHEVLETETGQPFLLMDLLEGESLRTMLRRNKRFDAAQCATIFVPVASAVEAAHALGIVHRDLKPENIFLVGGRDVRVLDFGIAKQLPRGDETASASLTSTGAVLGTPHYMAPEQVFGDEDLDGRADVWALGIMLYECIAGMRPIDGIGLGPILKRITVEPIRPLHDAQPGAPPAICALVDRMLSRAKENRPSLAEVRDTLVRASSPEAEVPTRIDERPPRPQPAPPMHVMQPMMPPSTTMGVASRRTLDTPPPTASRRGSTIGVAVSAVLVVAGGSALTAMHFARQKTAATVSSASSSVASPSSSVADEPTSVSDPIDASETNAVASASARAALANANAAPTASSNAGEHANRARAAFDKRDGATCVRAFDEHDRAEPNAARHSTDAKSSISGTRAQCMMLAGDCEGGRNLYRAFRAAHDTMMAASNVELATDRLVASLCTATNVSPRDELNRASDRIHAAADGKRKATARECLDWYGSITRLAGTVPPRSSEDHIARIRDDVLKAAPACLARAGDCASSYRVFRDELVRARRPTPAEADIKDEYAVLTSELHLCEGTP